MKNEFIIIILLLKVFIYLFKLILLMTLFPDFQFRDIFFLKLCPIFVGTVLCQFSKYENMFLVHSSLLQNQAHFVPLS